MLLFVFNNYLVTAQGLSVEPNTNIMVLSGTDLKISGGDLLLKSDASGDGTLIALGSVSHGAEGKSIIQRYLPGASSSWHFVSSPVNDMPILGSDWEPGTDDDLYLWEEPSPGTWVNYKNTTTEPTFASANPGDNFVSGRAYIVSYNSDNPTKNFESNALHSGEFNITLEKNELKNWTWNAGFNLIGNPYSSGLDWSAVNKTGIITEEYAQIYNPNKEGGEGYEPTNGIIAPGQGFFVQAVSDAAVIALQPSQQAHTSGQLYKNENVVTDKLVLRLSNGQHFDETSLVLNESSTDAHDFYDASKFFSFSNNVPQIYTRTPEGRPLNINSVNEISETLQIPVSIKVNESKLMSVELLETTGGFEGLPVVLHDLQTNTQQQLSSNGTYNFFADPEDDQDRFILKFGTVGISDTPVSSTPNVWGYNNSLHVINPETFDVHVELYDIRGQLILQKTIGPGLSTIPVNVVSGAYLVTLRSNQTVSTRKLFIR